MTTLSITKTYANDSVLTEAMLDNIKNDVETWANNGNIDNTNISLGGILRFTNGGNDEISFNDTTDTFAFKVDGTNVFSFIEDTASITIKSLISDADLIFNVNDGGVDTAGLAVAGDTARVIVHKGINATNDLEIIDLGATASAVNQVKISNAATTGAPKIEALGDDTNVSLELDAKGAGIIKVNQAGVGTVIALTDGANIATDASLGNHGRVTLAGNRTLDNPTNPTDGQRFLWELIQDGTGSRTLTLGSAFALGTDVASTTLTTPASKRVFLGAVYNSTAVKWYVVLFVKGY